MIDLKNALEITHKILLKYYMYPKLLFVLSPQNTPLVQDQKQFGFPVIHSEEECKRSCISVITIQHLFFSRGLENWTPYNPGDRTSKIISDQLQQ